MIQNDQELRCTQERIAYFEGLVAQFRVSTPLENFSAMAGGYLAEIEKMHAEIMEYLSRHVSEFEPVEAALEFVNESGTSSRLAPRVKPNQVKDSDEIAKEIFERGIDLLNRGRQLEAEREFQRAIDLMPGYIGVLHNSIVKSFGDSSNWQGGMAAMRLVLRIDPQYKPARDNLAIAFLNLGVQKANEGDIEAARSLYHRALGIESSQAIISDIRKNLAATYTSLGLQSHRSSRFRDALNQMFMAYEFDPNNNTRHNLGLAYAIFARSLVDQGELEAAISYFESAEDAGLVMPELLSDYGATLALSNRLDQAIRAFERALELAPENKVIQANLERAKNYDMAGFSTEELSAEFHPPPPMQSQNYVAA